VRDNEIINLENLDVKREKEMRENMYVLCEKLELKGIGKEEEQVLQHL
jgi:hypothetical protein